MSDKAKNIKSDLPGKMPVDMDVWLSSLGISSFINAYYQYRDLEKLPKKKSVLIVGPGQGLAVAILKWRGYNVTTIDVDQSVQPDLICSVHDMGIFKDKQFDVVIVSHVLEHLPPKLLPNALSEIRRVGEYSIVYLPHAGKRLFINIDFGIRNIVIRAIFDFVNKFRKPFDDSPRFCENQHYWEIGVPGYSKKQMRCIFLKDFKIISEYRNYFWPVSYNYVLQAR